MAMHIRFHLVLYEEMKGPIDTAGAPVPDAQPGSMQPVARVLMFHGSESAEPFFDFQTFDCDAHG
ncbi:MAG: hypothetical protein ABSG16_22760 [Candidatus Acidiferrum sp.]|jgi:hypothetical protein